MSHEFSISDIGLRLIKAYEGFSAKEQRLRGGRKIIGYGRVTHDLGEYLSEKEAEDLLMSDLAAIENIVNANIHAAMSQSQFDALCSLAYSIGPDAFLGSDVLHAMNRGEVITAANAIDVWRLGNIDGEIYVIDALVRRRTAEKALFLRSAKMVPAPHEVLKATRDNDVAKEQLVQTVITQTPENRPSNIVTLHDKGGEAAKSEIQAIDVHELTDRVDEESPASPIAEAAAEVSGRLDALMENTSETDTASWPDSLVEDSDAEDLPFSETDHPRNTEEAFAEDQNQIRPDASDSRYASADKYIEPGQAAHAKQNFWAFITMIILGLTMAGGGLWAQMSGNQQFGSLSRLLWSVSVTIGIVLLIMGLYYLLKQLFGKS